MVKILDKAIQIGDKVYVFTSVMLLAVLVIVVSAGIIMRYFFNSPFDWTEEMVTLLFIWISFLGAAVASARHKHVVVDFITARFSPRTRNIIAVVSDVLTIVFLIMVIIGSVILIPQMLTHGSTALNIPKSVYYLAVFASSLLIFCVHLSSFIKGAGSLLAAGKKQEGSP